MIAKISLIICLLAMIATVSIPMACYGRLSAVQLGDLPFLFLIIGPYLLLGLMAWRWRGHRGVSVAALVLILIVASAGLFLFGYDCYSYRGDPQYRLYDRYAIPIAILLQWLGTGLLGLVILVVWLKSKRSQKGQPAA
jgi:hypothetical protein